MQVTTELLEVIRQECGTFMFPISRLTTLSLVKEIERLRADNARLREAMLGTEKAWDELSEGHYSPKVIHAWLNGPMINAMRRARAALEGK